MLLVNLVDFLAKSISKQQVPDPMQPQLRKLHLPLKAIQFFEPPVIGRVPMQCVVQQGCILTVLAVQVLVRMPLAPRGHTMPGRKIGSQNPTK